MNITVYGAGAIGGITGAKVALAGHDVTFVDKVPEHVDLINRQGLLVTGISEERVRAPAMLPDDMQGYLETVFLCVKAQDTAASMETLMPHIGPETTVVSLQNGLNEELIASLIGAHRTVGCLVNWGGDYIEPGHILYGGDGPMRIGELDGSTTERIVELQKVLNNVAETTITPNIFGHLWSKVIWGCFYIGNALGTSTTVDMLREDRNRPILLALFKEGVEVAEADGVTLETLTEHHFNPPELVRSDPAVALPHFDLMADCFEGHVKVYSGPWRDVAVRKRPTEVDYIIGPIVERGAEHGVPTPLNDKLVEIIKEIERGERVQDDANLLELEPLLT